MDGWQYLDEFVKIKPKINKKIYIYIVTSSISDEDHDRAKAYSAVSQFVIKPVTPDQIKELLGIERTQ